MLIRRRIADRSLLAWLGLLVFFVLLGGTELAVTGTLLRALDAAIGGVLIWLWVQRMPREADALDRIALLALLGFLAACTFSRFARQSFDAGVAATAYVAAFYLARRLLARPDARRLVVGALAGLSLGISLSFALAWSLVWLEWLRLTDFRTLPFTDLPLPAGAYRHPQVIGMFVALLLPAQVLVLRAGRPAARGVAIVAIVSTLAVMVMSGSRTTWLAAAVALCVPAALALRASSHRSRIGWRTVAGSVAAGLVVMVVVALMVASPGGAGDAAERLTDISTLGARGRIWASAFGTLMESLLTGAGPGTFVMTLGTSGFYDESPFTPRHADNALIQLLAEGGLVAAAGVLAACVVWFSMVFRRGASARSGAAAWAVSFFMLASLGDNPTDTAYLVGVLLVWAAFAAPRPAVVGPPAGGAAEPRGSGSPGVASRRLRAAAVTVLAVVAVGMSMTLVASARFDEARRELYAGNPAAAAHDLDVALALDPSFALYHRERAAVALVIGDAQRAESELERASALNPVDDAAFRALAIIRSLDARHAEAIDAARHAVAVERIDTANLLTLALVEQRGGRSAPADEHLREALQLAPWLPGSRQWGRYFATGNDLAALLSSAADEWASGEGTSVIVSMQPTWLVGLAGRSDLADTAHAEAIATPAAAESLTLALSCGGKEAIDLLERAAGTESHAADYWAARIVAGRVARDAANEARVLALTRVRSGNLYYLATAVPPEYSPIADPEEDGRMYRRESLPDINRQVVLPTSAGGASEWLRDPRGAAGRGAPRAPLAWCR
ncbi:MAG: O-antigen ligase family protein [Candidatus Limnocylindria bacterium]